MNLDQVYIYRMTHIDNIPHILKHGITHATDPKANPAYKPIGDQSLITNRKAKKIFVDNGDYWNLNAEEIILGDFIPFYFGIKMPMLYVIKHGGNLVNQSISSEKIVYLACRLKEVIIASPEFYFTDGHAMDAMTSTYDSKKINELPKIIDWTAVKTAYWGGHENLDVKRKKQAEFLCGQRIPSKIIKGFVCYNELAKNNLIAYGIAEEQIKIYPKAYF